MVVVAAPAGLVLAGRDLGEVVGEEVEPLVHREPGVDEGQRLGRRQGVREDALVPAPAQRAQAPVQDLGGRWALGPDGEVRDVVLAPPGPEPCPAAGPAQRVVGHRRVSVRGGRRRQVERGARRRRPTTGAGAERGGTVPRVLLLATDARFAEHDTGPGHPERAARLQAVDAGLVLADLGTDLVDAGPARGHPRRSSNGCTRPTHLDALEAVCARRGHFDADTPASAGSWTAALTAAGAGLAAVDALRDGRRATARSSRSARPGTTPRPSQAMGFCLREQRGGRRGRVARRAASASRSSTSTRTTATAPRRSSTRDPDVLYVSFHEWPLYPGTGPPRRDRHRRGDGRPRATCRSRPARPATSTSAGWTRWSRRCSRSSRPPGC